MLSGLSTGFSTTSNVNVQVSVRTAPEVRDGRQFKDSPFASLNRSFRLDQGITQSMVPVSGCLRATRRCTGSSTQGRCA